MGWCAHNLCRNTPCPINTCLMKAAIEGYHWGEANITSVIDENVTKAVCIVILLA